MLAKNFGENEFEHSVGKIGSNKNKTETTMGTSVKDL
jgi:hypothetical protein